MPELPEVETLRGDLERESRGHRLVRVEVRHDRMIRGQARESIQARLEGQVVEAVTRRGKYLLMHLRSADTLLLHRGMSGNLLLRSPRDPEGLHCHLSMEMDDGRFLAVYDPRGFGEIQVLSAEALAQRCRQLGPEPLGPAFTPDYLAGKFAKRVAPVKSLLLDQRLIAGLGNIYADESLWAARLDPRRGAGTLSLDEIDTLHQQIRSILTEATEWRGTTFRSALDLYGQPGAYVERLKVFHRAPLPCPRCAAPLHQIRVSNRGTTLCPACQV